MLHTQGNWGWERQRGGPGCPAEPQAPALGPLRVLQNVGCDFEIDSGALEDRCGVCHGDGSTCHTVRETFQEADDKGTGVGGGGGNPPGGSPPRLERGSRETTELGPGSKQELGHLALGSGLSPRGLFLPSGAQAGPISLRGPSAPPPHPRVFYIHCLSANYISRGGTEGDVFTVRHGDRIF